MNDSDLPMAEATKCYAKADSLITDGRYTLYTPNDMYPMIQKRSDEYVSSEYFTDEKHTAPESIDIMDTSVRKINKKNK